LADFSPVGIFHVNQEGYLLHANPQSYKILDLTAEEARNLGWKNAIHPDDRLMVVKVWEEMLFLKKPFRTEFRIVHKNGDILWVMSMARPEPREEAQLPTFVQAIIDINDRKLLESKEVERLEAVQRAEKEQRHRAEEAEENKRRLTNYIDMFTHGLRNPLMGIQGSNDFIQKSILEIQTSSRTSFQPKCC
jgi:PAS domain S-box-containing protein